jgi:Sulfotransferase family
MTPSLADPLPLMLRQNKRPYVIPELKILYMSMAKNACTSLKWLMAELAEEDLAGFNAGLGNATAAYEAIHYRQRFLKVPLLSDLTPELRSQIHPDNGWFVFAVVRDPRVRVFSAWEDKFLLRNPKYAVHRDEPWYPRLPSSVEVVVEDFAAFVKMLDVTPSHPLHKDSHFSRQKRLLAERIVSYSAIYDISELAQFQSDLRSHLKTVGSDAPVSLRQFNDTPLIANGPVFRGGVRETLETIYARDFDRFGEKWNFDRIEARPEWGVDALKHADAVIAMSERITQLRRNGSRYRSANEVLTRRVARLERRVARLKKRLAPPPPDGGHLVGRVTRPLGKVKRRLGKLMSRLGR